MIVAVTGGLGLVGTAVSAGLRRAGYEPVILDRREPAEAAAAASAMSEALAQATGVESSHIVAPSSSSRVRTVDLGSYDETRAALIGVDAVVHLAGINSPISAPEWRVHDNNVLASNHVLTAAAELAIPRVVQSSSVNAIGLSWSRNPSFDYFPVDLDHPTRNEDGYSLSKLIQEFQADSLTRRHPELSVVSLRLHAVLDDAAQAQAYIDRLGAAWAVNGLFGYCTFESTVDAIVRACTAPIQGHERLWVVEPETYLDVDSRTLASRYYPSVPLRASLDGRASFFDASRTSEVLGWRPSTLDDRPVRLARLPVMSTT